MKKFVHVLLAVLFTLLFLAGCSSKPALITTEVHCTHFQQHAPTGEEVSYAHPMVYVEVNSKPAGTGYVWVEVIKPGEKDGLIAGLIGGDFEYPQTLPFDGFVYGPPLKNPESQNISFILNPGRYTLRVWSAENVESGEVIVGKKFFQGGFTVSECK